MSEELEKLEQLNSPIETKVSSLGKRRMRRHSPHRLHRLISRVRRRLQLRSIAISLFTVAIFGLILLFVNIIVSINNLGSSWDRTIRVLNAIENSQGIDLTFEDLNRVRVAINDLDLKIYVARTRINLVRPILELNSEWKTSIALLDAADLLVYATTDMLNGLQPVTNFLQNGDNNESIATKISSGERIVELLQIGRGSFHNATLSLESVGKILVNIDLNSVSTDFLLNFDDIQSYYKEINSINSILVSSSDILAKVLGVEEDTTYLIIGQNNDQLRPSGGYISTSGWFTLRNGRVTDFDFSPTSTTSPKPPDSSFLETFDVPQWWLNFQNPIYAAWEGSWHVDFPSTAQLAMDYYNAGENPNSPVDGVIALDIDSFELILQALGGIDIPDSDLTLTTDNLRQTIYNARIYGSLDHERFLASIYRLIFEEWQNIDQGQSTELITLLLEALTQHHMMIYLPDEDSQSIIRELGWSGEQYIPNSNDYLLVADTNLVNKSNNSIIRSLIYDVNILPDQSRTSHLRVRYDYFDSLAKNDPAIDPENHGPRDYKTLTQIYLPNDANIVEENGLKQSSINDLADYTLVVTRVDVGYDTSERIELSYETPAVEDRLGNLYRYRLLIQKQLGSQIEDVNLQIRLPQNAQIIRLSPDADAGYELEQPILDYQLQLVSDQWIEVIYSLD